MARRNQTRMERAEASIARAGGQFLGYGQGANGPVMRIRTAGGRTMSMPAPHPSSDK